MAEALPARLGEALADAEGGEAVELDLQEFYARLHGRQEATMGQVVERVQAVFAALSRWLGHDKATYLVRRLPDDFTPLFSVPEEARPVDPSREAGPDTPAADLLEGAEVDRPHVGGRPAQTGSVHEANPHANRKLSSAKSAPTPARSLTEGTGTPHPHGDLAGARPHSAHKGDEEPGQAERGASD